MILQNNAIAQPVYMKLSQAMVMLPLGYKSTHKIVFTVRPVILRIQPKI